MDNNEADCLSDTVLVGFQQCITKQIGQTLRSFRSSLLGDPLEKTFRLFHSRFHPGQIFRTWCFWTKWAVSFC